jgi:hypothetical protein
MKKPAAGFPAAGFLIHFKSYLHYPPPEKKVRMDTFPQLIATGVMV